jgi:hypothetical protein
MVYGATFWRLNLKYNFMNYEELKQIENDKELKNKLNKTSLQALENYQDAVERLVKDVTKGLYKVYDVVRSAINNIIKYMSNIKQITITKPTSIKYQGMFNTNPTTLKLQVGQKIVNINGSFIYHDGSKNGLELDNITVANFVNDNQDKVKIDYKAENLF